MRLKFIVACVIAVMSLLLISTTFAQDADFPTLDALASMDMPVYDGADTYRRFGWGPDFPAPEPKLNPPIYQIGDRELFFLADEEGNLSDSVTAELRGMTENVLIWVEESAAYWRQRSQTTAEWIENSVLAPFQQMLNYRQPPGIDADPRVTVLLVYEPGFWSGGYFESSVRTYVYDANESNEREMLVINIADDRGSIYADTQIRTVIVHEYQHNLMYFRDENEESWVDEGLAVLFEYLIGGSDPISRHAEAFFEAPDTSLTTMYQSPGYDADYGAAGLFMLYLAERFGEEIIARLHAESVNGWRSVQKVLREYADASADEVFADWVLANYFLEAGFANGYAALDSTLKSPRPATTLRSFPATHTGSLPQYSSEYLELDTRGAAALSLQLTQAPEAQLMDVAPAEGESVFYGATSNNRNSRLTREIDLTDVYNVFLEYKIWHDLVEFEEDGYVSVSTDGGETWTPLVGMHTRNYGPDGYFNVDNYTGRSEGWLDERIGLILFGGRPILIRFELLTGFTSAYRGMAIDDLRIEAIDFYDGFESHDDAWTAEGWIRTDNRLPNNTWLQVVQESADGLDLTRSLMAGPGDMTIDLLPGVERALIAISPVVPKTGLETEYTLEVNLLDADGNIIDVQLSCQLTTSSGLNFRDAPNGDKIGLVPHGTALWALDSSGDWFQVEYGNLRGWIHGGYVTREGDCP